MARKKKPPKQTKRLEVTGPDGWTHIIQGLKSVHLKNPPRLANQPPEIPENQTVKDLEKTHARYRTQWLASACYQHTEKMFLEDVIPGLTSIEKSGGGRIDRCVMLGLGSLSNGQRSSWWELVFLESVLALLSPASPPSPASATTTSSPSHLNFDESKSSSGLTSFNGGDTSTTPSPSIPTTQTTPLSAPIPIYIQDPIFNSLDLTYLSSSLNFTVLDHPAAFAEITPTTFLFAPHLEMGLYARTLGAPAKNATRNLTGQLEHFGPRLCVGTDVTECTEQLKTKLGKKEGGEEEDAERRRQEGVFAGYKDATAERLLPGFERDDWMGFTCVYWAKGLMGREEGI
ncbi:MAG: hypothetical protein Q9168_002579 [Polycauliona sp. 1 TL-2023]